MAKLDRVLAMLAAGEKLPDDLRDHALVGRYRGWRECHIEPDWLLIYEADDAEVVLRRTGTHSDFGF